VKCLNWLLASSLVCGLLLGASSAAAQRAACSEVDTEALDWLARMARSHSEVAYHGVVTLQRGDDMQVVQVARSLADGYSSEHLTRLTGQGAQVIRSHHPLNCTHPGERLLNLGDRVDPGDCGLAGYYRFQLSPGERIAGRQSVKLEIQPRDMYRYGFLLELDKETALMLRASTLGRGDKVLERFQFADLSYGEPLEPRQGMETIHPASHPHPDYPAAGARLTVPWTVSWLPGGFTATDTVDPAGPRRTYTDGLAVFSVFLEQLPRELRPGEGLARLGSSLSYTRGMHLADQPVLVTVIGEVPVNTARMVADSIRVAR
jgi:sigma-E factor negative regulatory protein RseB|tara:strand:- start:5658 stop:6611 length:954 start_codon:yes stop_codon:yes gene_type:complete